MKIAYFDTIGGVSGDMTLGAFVSAGVRLDELARIIPLLGLDGVELTASHLVRHGITAVKVEVAISAPQHGHRHLSHILEMIGRSGLPPRVRERAELIFREVGRAEAKVHNTTIEKVHFHEVGALDSIVDIVGAAYCMELMGIERVYSSPVRLGHGGFIDAAHGRLPLPGPAATEILRDYPTVLTSIPYELTTPTGAAIIRALSSGMLADEPFTVRAVGYGAGTREMAEAPNLLRLLIGEIAAGGEHDEMAVIETTIDDMSPELYPGLIEQLLSEGRAADAYVTPVLMKKGRPGMVVSVLAERGNVDAVVGLLMTQTTTIGVRVHGVRRVKAVREIVEVETIVGKVKAKAIAWGGRRELVPEYEECRKVSLERKIPLREVYELLKREFAPKSSNNNSLG